MSAILDHEPAVAPEAPASAAALDSLLGAPASRSRWRRPATWLAVLVVAASLAGVLWWHNARHVSALPRYITEPVTRGHLVVSVTANGTLQPTHKVDIGSELSGTVARVNVDVNDHVSRGQVLAVLDTDKLGDQVRRTRAALALAEARVRQSAATVAESRGNLSRLEDVARRSGGQVPSQAELASARASLARAEADESATLATVADARAALSVDETNLRKASMRSPIDGVVLSRTVDPGNAVAASLQAVTLFTLAEDLAQMKLQVNVDEADVGQVREGQRASFTVSAYPDRRYPATITRVGYGSTTKDNVVTYLAELSVANADLTLRPGMTATAVISAAERDGVLLVPNSALRFRPAGAAAAAASASVVSRLVPRMPLPGTRRGGAGGAAHQVWTLRDGQPVPVQVTSGASDGRMTEVSGDGVQPGMAVIVDQAAGSAR